jgi:hypothetical protein
MSAKEHHETIYIVDHVTAKPGRAQAFLDAYMERYAPAAKERGMTLVSRLVAPPMWLTDQSNTLLITWTVEGAGAWWGMSHQGRRNPAVREFWESVGGLIEKRHRSFFSDVADVESICDV